MKQPLDTFLNLHLVIVYRFYLVKIINSRLEDVILFKGKNLNLQVKDCLKSQTLFTDKSLNFSREDDPTGNGLRVFF